MLDKIWLSRTPRKLFPSPLLTDSSTLATDISLLLVHPFQTTTTDFSPSTFSFCAYDSQGQEGTIPQNSSSTFPFAYLLILFHFHTPAHLDPPNGMFLVISHYPLLYFVFTELQTVTTSIFVFREMAIYVMPEEFSRIRVLDSKLSDQENLMELSSYDVVLPQPPYRFHRTVCFSLL
uniref:Uncharacterized protein n=1 Tax=Brassica campestris TaxID=3711 RepID=M4F812_BRACM